MFTSSVTGTACLYEDGSVVNPHKVNAIAIVQARPKPCIPFVQFIKDNFHHFTEIHPVQIVQFFFGEPLTLQDSSAVSSEMFGYFQCFYANYPLSFLMFPLTHFTGLIPNTQYPSSMPQPERTYVISYLFFDNGWESYSHPCESYRTTKST